jgi:hypothetical protein
MKIAGKRPPFVAEDVRPLDGVACLGIGLGESPSWSMMWNLLKGFGFAHFRTEFALERCVDARTSILALLRDSRGRSQRCAHLTPGRTHGRCRIKVGPIARPSPLLRPGPALGRVSAIGSRPENKFSLWGFPILTRSRHRAEAFQIEAQAGRRSGIPPAKMAQRVSLSEGEGFRPLYVAMSRARKDTDQRVGQRSTHRVRDFVFARFPERPVFARPNLWCMIFIDREGHGVIEQTGACSWAAKMSLGIVPPNAAIEPRRAGAE